MSRAILWCVAVMQVSAMLGLIDFSVCIGPPGYCAKEARK